VTMSLRVIDADGSDERVLREEKGPVFLASPDWAPDGTRIAFARSVYTETAVEHGLYITTTDGSKATLAAPGGAQPAWSPDGEWPAFTKGGPGQTCFHECSASGEIYVTNGDRVRRLTKSKAEDMSPTWSESGDEIVFSSDRSNPPSHELELCAIPARGGEPRRLTRNKVWDLDPDWRQSSVGYGWSMPDESSRKPGFEAWRGFRTRSGGIHCFMTGKRSWTGFACFRATDGFYVQMVGRDLSTEDPVRVLTGTNPGLLGYENGEVKEIEPGDHWYSSDAQMVGCSVRLSSVRCRHASDRGFFLDETRYKRF